MYRSGSTWTFNVCRRLFQELRPHETLHTSYQDEQETVIGSLRGKYQHLVLKCHSLDDVGRELCSSGKAFAIYSYRELMDAISSLMLAFAFNFEESLERIRESLELREFHRKNPTSYLIPYEAVRHSHKKTIAGIASFLELELTVEVHERLAQETSFESMRRISSQISEEQGAVGAQEDLYDPTTHIHRNHVRDGSSGYGQVVLNEKQKQLTGDGKGFVVLTPVWRGCNRDRSLIPRLTPGPAERDSSGAGRLLLVTAPTVEPL